MTWKTEPLEPHAVDALVGRMLNLDLHAEMLRKLEVSWFPIRPGQQHRKEVEWSALTFPTKLLAKLKWPLLKIAFFQHDSIFVQFTFVIPTAAGSPTMVPSSCW